MNRLFPQVWLLLMMALLLNACSSTLPPVKHERITYRITHQPSTAIPPKATANIPSTYFGVFQKPGELEPAVEFWRNTYAVWHRSEVAFHDDRYLDVIYEVMVLPGYVAEGLTEDQKEIVSQRRNFWKAQLADLENKVRYNTALNASDRQLIAKLQSGGRALGVLNGASERLRSQRGIRERFKRGLEISGRYDSQFRKIFRDAGLPEQLAYLPHVESSFQPGAKSSAGAVGMWQFTKAAAQTFMAGSGRVDRRLDPVASAYGAARYLSYAYNKLGDWPVAITSYNHGIGGMKRAQNQAGRDFANIVMNYDGPAFGFASRNYYSQFLAACEIASNPMQYFAEGVQYETPLRNGQNLALK